MAGVTHIEIEESVEELEELLRYKKESRLKERRWLAGFCECTTFTN